MPPPHCSMTVSDYYPRRCASTGPRRAASIGLRARAGSSLCAAPQSRRCGGARRPRRLRLWGYGGLRDYFAITRIDCAYRGFDIAPPCSPRPAAGMAAVRWRFSRTMNATSRAPICRRLWNLNVRFAHAGADWRRVCPCHDRSTRGTFDACFAFNCLTS